jgi:hypothetical protein
MRPARLSPAQTPRVNPPTPESPDLRVVPKLRYKGSTNAPRFYASTASYIHSFVEYDSFRLFTAQHKLNLNRDTAPIQFVSKVRVWQSALIITVCDTNSIRIVSFNRHTSLSPPMFGPTVRLLRRHSLNSVDTKLNKTILLKRCDIVCFF